MVGPTASGKSALAHAVAVATGADVVVADPFQRYRGLEIAADAPTAAERDEVRYHLVGDLALHEASTAGAFADRAHEVIDAALAAGRPVVVTGGTGLYVRAALSDLGLAAPVPAAVRAAAEALVSRDPRAALARLAGLDAEAAARVEAANPRRLARALELAEAGLPAARPSAPLWDGATRHPTRLVAVTRPRDVLDALIARRVDRELADGLVAEIAAAMRHPRGMSREAAQIIGVRELAAVERGEMAAADLPAALAARTRRLARKQLTWLRKTPGVEWIDLGDAPATAAAPALCAGFA